MRQHLAATLLVLASPPTLAQDEIDCKGSPKKAVLQVPEPLDRWGRVACTPWGHIIRSRDGWDWAQAGGAPVFVPAQMVAEPKELGHKAHFTEIRFNRVFGAEFDAAYNAFMQDLDAEQKVPEGYRLVTKSSLGTAVKLYFFDYGESVWGIWCADQCAPASRFMLLHRGN